MKRTQYHREYGKQRREQEKKNYKKYYLVLPVELANRVERISKEKNITKKKAYQIIIEAGLQRFTEQDCNPKHQEESCID